jgi:hypothetical protein
MLSTGSFIQDGLASQIGMDLSFARGLFEEARNKATKGKLLSLLGLYKKMISLGDCLRGRIVVRQHSAGLLTVEIGKIRGSESRSKDFDGSFHPFSDLMRERWTRIALARLNGLPLPPVELIQVGEEFFVRDGHHRISVARAFGADYIEANVTVLDF